MFESVFETFELIATLEATGLSSASNFGWSVAIAGETLIAGAPDSTAEAASQGIVKVFVKTPQTWQEQAALKSPMVGAYDKFGSCVSIANGQIGIGAPSHDSASLQDSGLISILRPL